MIVEVTDATVQWLVWTPLAIAVAIFAVSIYRGKDREE